MLESLCFTNESNFPYNADP